MLATCHVCSGTGSRGGMVSRHVCQACWGTGTELSPLAEHLLMGHGVPWWGLPRTAAEAGHAHDDQHRTGVDTRGRPVAHRGEAIPA